MASERGAAQTDVVEETAVVATWGLEDLKEEPQLLAGVNKGVASGRTLERSAGEGESPVRESDTPPVSDPEYHGTRGTLWEAGGTTPQG